MSYEIMSSRTRSGISLVVLGEQCLFPVTLDPESNLPAEWQVQDDNGVVSFVFYVLCFMFYVLCFMLFWIGREKPQPYHQNDGEDQISRKNRG